MYVTISLQKLTGNFSQSVRDFVSYLGKENETKLPEEQEPFFNQHGDNFTPLEVINDIDKNTAKLKKVEPKYYSITINPSKYELEHIKGDALLLKKYTRMVMKEYAGAFHREINGKPITADDIKYFAKIEYQRSYKGTDREIKENTPFLKRKAKLEYDIIKIKRGENKDSTRRLTEELKALHQKAPHKINGKIIEQGMLKKGLQTHIHIIVSRKDASNTCSLSPGSKYRSSEVLMHGKMVKRGFDRNQFFLNAEKTFDKTFSYKRHYVESYTARKTFKKNPQQYYSLLKELSINEKRMAFQILGRTGIGVPYLNISPNQVSFALKQIKKALEIGIRSSSIGY